MNDTLELKIPFAGFYNSAHDDIFNRWLEYETEINADILGDDCELLEKLEESFFSGINWQAAHNAYSREYVETLQHWLKENAPFARLPVISLEFKKLTSPREYNFRTDEIFASISVNDASAMLESIDRQKLVECIKERHTSCSGFTSFYSNDLEEWPARAASFDNVQLETLLTCYLSQICHECESVDLSEFLHWQLMEETSGRGDIDNIIFSNASLKFIEITSAIFEAREEAAGRTL
jgi:hypothetical protein